jgi:hypothetical protein
LTEYYEAEKVTLSVTLAELSGQRSSLVNPEPVETSAGFVEPAIRIERTTCGLRISDRGIAEVLDRSGYLPSLCGVQPLTPLFLFVALCLH